MCRPPGLTIQIAPRTLSFPTNFAIKGFDVLPKITDKCGMAVLMTWNSQDGKLTSLSGVHCSELISEPVSATGCFQGVLFHVSSRFDTHCGSAHDQHGFPAAHALNGRGEITLDQLFVYGHEPWTAAPNSGFRITHKVEEIAPGRFKVTTSKVPAAVAFSRFVKSGANGVMQAAVPYRSQAGQGRASVIQIVERGGRNPSMLVKADLTVR